MTWDFSDLCLDECRCLCGDRRSVHAFTNTLCMFDADPYRHGFGCPNKPSKPAEKPQEPFKIMHHCSQGCGNVVESPFPSSACESCTPKVCEMECSRCIQGCLQGIEVRSGEEAHAHAFGCPCAEKKPAGGAKVRPVRFWLRIPKLHWSEVTKEAFIAAERSLGFHSKFGPGELATGGFSSGAIEGSITYSDEEARKKSQSHMSGLIQEIETLKAHSKVLVAANTKHFDAARTAQEENAQLKIAVKNLESELKNQKSHHAETSLALELANRTNRTLRAEMDTIHSRIASVVMNELERIKKS